MRRTFLRAGERCVRVACAGSIAVGLLLAAPASAQWIGSAGGDGAPPAKPPTAPLTPPPTAAAAPALSSPALAEPEAPGFGDLPNGGLAPPTGGFSREAGGGGAPRADCQSGVLGLRSDVEKNGEALKRAATRKRPPTEICPLFRRFVSSQEKFYNYLAKNKSNCGVPDEALKTLKANIAQVSTTRNKVCEVAENGPPPGAAGPPEGRISSGLGLPSGLPSINNDRPGGVYDTLGGNALR